MEYRAEYVKEFNKVASAAIDKALVYGGLGILGSGVALGVTTDAITKYKERKKVERSSIPLINEINDIRLSDNAHAMASPASAGITTFGARMASIPLVSSMTGYIYDQAEEQIRKNSNETPMGKIFGAIASKMSHNVSTGNTNLAKNVFRAGSLGSAALLALAAVKGSKTHTNGDREYLHSII